ncbi:hypothetical protein [Spirulina subsalsa]|uniref:hypothetical protein n=1 Tax=Spirulina subsalsa TaxID=54311 RepID=UPI00031E1D35|nr:hypothetical protein [Spirulina subsalsa]
MTPVDPPNQSPLDDEMLTPPPPAVESLGGSVESPSTGEPGDDPVLEALARARDELSTEEVTLNEALPDSGSPWDDPLPESGGDLPESQASRVLDQLSGTEEMVLDRAQSLQEADWFALARKLRQRNRDLLKRVATLEQSLAQTQEELQGYKRRVSLQEGSRSRGVEPQSHLLASQNEDLQTAQAQVNLLFEELEASHRVAQRQHFLIETLTAQLEAAQSQIVHLEQEYQRAQQRYQVQGSVLLEAAENSQELRDRLTRQQQHTRQFKAVLDRYLSPLEELETENLASAWSEDNDEDVEDLTQPPTLEASETTLEALSRPVEPQSEEIIPPRPSPRPEDTLNPPTPASRFFNPPPSTSGIKQPIRPWSAQTTSPESIVGEPPSWVSRMIGQTLPDPQPQLEPAPVLEQPPTPEPPPKPSPFINLSLPDFKKRSGIQPHPPAPDPTGRRVGSLGGASIQRPPSGVKPTDY